MRIWTILRTRRAVTCNALLGGSGGALLADGIRPERYAHHPPGGSSALRQYITLNS